MAARSAASAPSAADAASSGAAVAGGGAVAATGGASLGSSPVAAARPAFFFFLDFFEGACALACSAASSASSFSIAASAFTACAACSACTASTVAAGCGGAVCCRMSSAVAAWPWASAYCSAVRPASSSSSVLALARSRARTHDFCPAGRVLQQDEQDGEEAFGRSIHERGDAEVGLQVDARASLQQLPHHLQLVAGCGGVYQGHDYGLTVNNWSRTERVDRPALTQPLGHLQQLASGSRVEDLDGQRGGRALRRLASVWWGGRRGGGRLRRRGVLPDEVHDGGVALMLGVLQRGEAVFVEQLGVGLGPQQGLHARLLPFDSGRNQGSAAVNVLQVGVGRVLQQEEQDGVAAVVSSIHERGPAEAAVAACSRPKAEVGLPPIEAEQSASTGPPLRSQLVTFCSSPRWADTKISTGSEAGELTAGSPASGGAAGEAAAGCGGAACCWMRATMAVWPCASAHCSAERLFSPSSSVLALARSRACTHASCPLAAAIIRAVLPLLDCRSRLAECCSRTSRTERWPWHAASMSAVLPRPFCRSTLAPRFSSSPTISRRSLVAAACSRPKVEARPSLVKAEQSASTGPPLPSHVNTFCSSPCRADS
eukprot:scaffold2548_cov66-Phaeocystis_antarctica.AAC.2